jgi:D-psicose/D-tagatose/L-ribulose 3-epimerase
MPFRMSSHNWMRPEPLEVTLERLSRLGYDSLEIMGEPAKYEPKETRALFKKYKLACWGTVTIMLQSRDLIHGDKYIRIGSIEYVKDCVTLSKELGGEIITIVPSEVGKIAPMSDPETEWAWAVEGLKIIADHARKKGIRIGIEPLNRFETNFINRHDQGLALADEVGEDIGVTLDAFHINIEEEDPFAAIRKVGDRLVDFHLADNNRRPPGEGTYDWPKVIKTLQEVGYTGSLTAEFVVPGDRSPLAKRVADAGTTGSAEELKFIRDHGSDLMSDEEYSKHFENCIAHIRKSEPSGV